MRMYQMKGHFKGFPKLVIYHSCLFQRRRNMLLNVQTHYRKVTEERLKSGIFSAFLEPASAALILLETAVIALIWLMIQLEAFLTLLARVLQLKEQLNQQIFLNKYLFNQNLYIANRSFNV